mgnify:CR=1 FL=1
MGASHRPARLPFRGGPRMNNPWLAALSALFLWWFSTGIIIWRVKRADHQGRDAHLWSVILGLPLVVGGAAALDSIDFLVGLGIDCICDSVYSAVRICDNYYELERISQQARAAGLTAVVSPSGIDWLTP